MYLQVDHEIVFPPSGSNSTQQLDTVIFRLLLVRNLIEEAGKSQDHLTPRLVGRRSAGTKNVLGLESHHNKHWPAGSPTQLRCLLCFSHGQRKGTVYKCAQMWCGPVRGALFCGILHQSKFVNHPNCEYRLSWQNNDPRCHRPSAATKIMWVMNYLHHILYNACDSQA